MNQISQKNMAMYFYIGTLFSSIGSMALSVSLVSFMLASGFDLLQVGLVIGVSRFVPVVISILAGHKFDLFSPRKMILWTELAAAGASSLLFIAWNGLDRNFLLILTAMILRSIFTSAQTGSRSQIAKILSQNTYESNSRNAIWLNKVTQGATLFGAVVAWAAFKYATFEAVIAFDGLTFIANGLILFFLPIVEAPVQESVKVSFLKKFRDLYGPTRWVATLDALLVVSAMGASSFSARLAGTEEIWIPLLVISYGLAVWISGFIERIGYVQRQRFAPWVVLGTSLIWLGFFEGPSVLMWFVYFVRSVAFWIIFHRISAHIQNDTPKVLVSSVSFARNAQVVSIFALGEIAVGSWKSVLSLQNECLLRAGVCFLAMFLIALRGQREHFGKAHL